VTGVVLAAGRSTRLGTVPLDVDTWDDYERLLAAGPP
jgi:CTP:molybdopterin cytidylyltransferase MocA